MRSANRVGMGAVMVSALAGALLAQPLAPPVDTIDKAPERMPGLDKQSIDTTANPCEDFSQYACGNFPKLHPTPKDRSGFGTGAMVADYNEYVLHTMLEQAAGRGGKRTANEQKIGDYYSSCMDTEAINRKGLTPTIN